MVVVACSCLVMYIICKLFADFEIMKTSITKTQASKHIAEAAYRAEFPCTFNAGFHLQKLRKGGSWRLRFQMKGGKQKIIKLCNFVDGAKDKTDACSLAEDYIYKINQGIDPAIAKEKAINQDLKESDQAKRDQHQRENNTIRSYLDGLYAAHQRNKKNEGKHTLDMIRHAFVDYLDTPMDQFSKVDLANWQQKHKTNDKGIKRSHETLVRSYGAFKTMLKHAYKNDVIDTFQLSEIALLGLSDAEKEERESKDNTKTRRMLTDDELASINTGLDKYRQQLIDGRESTRLHGKRHLPSFKNMSYPSWFFPFFRLAAYTGMRPGDLYNLYWHQLNLDFKRLVKVPNKTRHHANPCKIDIHLDDNILAVMRDWHSQIGSPSEGLVFPSPVNGRVMDKKAHTSHWANVMKYSELDHRLDFYSLRHHFISKLIVHGVPLSTVATLAGHKSTKMIEEHYKHLTQNAAADAMAIISGDFAGQQNTGSVLNG
jgi:integrase